MNIKLSEFNDGEDFVTFEGEHGIFLSEVSAPEIEGKMAKVIIREEVEIVPYSSCFHIGERAYRTYSAGGKDVLVKLHPIELTYIGGFCWVSYDERDEQREFFERNDKLHLDWDGKGIDIDDLVEKWLNRLSGDMIPLSNYYMDYYNRYLDSLGSF